MRKAAGKRSTIRDLFTVMSGTAGAQAIGLLVLPILSRAFAPEAFGVFQLYLSLLIFCTVGIALRIELTLLSRPEAEVEDTLATLMMLVVGVAAGLVTGFWLLTTFGLDLGFPVIFLGLGLVGNGFAQVASYLLIRHQRYSRLAAIKVLQVIVYAGVALSIALSSPTLWGIILADVVGRVAAGLLGLFVVRGQGFLIGGVSRVCRLAGFVRSNWEMAIISLPGALANSAGAMLTPFMIFQTFGAAAAGQFGLVDRAMGVPIAMIVTAGSQVFVGRLTALLRGGQYRAARSLFLKLITAGLLLCGIGAGLVYLLLPTAFALVFGPGWSMAAEIAQVMIFAYAVMLTVGVVNQTLIALSAFRLQSAWDTCWPILIGIAWVGVVTFNLDLYMAVRLHALAVGVLGLSFIVLCLFKLRARNWPLHTKGAA